jgi:hypothetical protein
MYYGVRPIPENHPALGSPHPDHVFAGMRLRALAQQAGVTDIDFPTQGPLTASPAHELKMAANHLAGANSAMTTSGEKLYLERAHNCMDEAERHMRQGAGNN